jgi:hypothetical protein
MGKSSGSARAPFLDMLREAIIHFNELCGNTVSRTFWFFYAWGKVFFLRLAILSMPGPKGLGFFYCRY